MRADNSWVLHHHNASAHSAVATRAFLAKTANTVLEHPPYSPLFPKTKKILKGAHFASEEVMKRACTGMMETAYWRRTLGVLPRMEIGAEKCVRTERDHILKDAVSKKKKKL